MIDDILDTVSVDCVNNADGTVTVSGPMADMFRSASKQKEVVKRQPEISTKVVE